MKNKENTIVKVYTQADNKKIAISMLLNKKDYYGRFNGKPDADAVSVFGDVSGVVVSLWGKLPVVLVSIEQFNKLAKQYNVIEYAGPVTGSGVREKKPRPDAAALKLYKILSDIENKCAAGVLDRLTAVNIDGYKIKPKDAADLLKKLKSAFQFTAADTAAALAMVIDTPADAEPAEQPAAVADTPAPAVEVAEVAADAPALVQAAKETGHLIICSVPKATPAPAPEVAAPVEDIEAAVEAHFADMVANAPADDMPADAVEIIPELSADIPAAPVKNKKEFAEYNGFIVEVLRSWDDNENDPVVIKLKGGARTTVAADKLQPTTAKKTALPAWMIPGAIVDVKSALRPDAEPSRHTIESIGTTTVYYTDGYKSMLNYLIDYGAPVEQLPEPPAVVVVDMPADAPAPEVAAVTDADIYAAAARIRANYEAMQADIEADKQRAADMFADAITAYCESIEPPAAPRWEPETIIITPVYKDAEPTPAPIHRRRLSLPRLRPAFRRLLRVAAVVLPLLVFALLTASSQTAAAPADAAAVAVAEAAPLVADAVADTVVYCAGELPPVEVCAPRTPAGQKCCTPSRSKNAVAVADTTAGQKTASRYTPSGQKTAPDAVADAPQPDSQPHGLTICAGTAWQYTMMNWV